MRIKINEGRAVMADVGKDKKDDFWDIDKLVPKKRASLSPFVSSDPVRNYEAPVPEEKKPVGSDGDGAVDGKGYTPEQRSLNIEGSKGTRASEAFTYIPDNMGLIKSVTVRHFIDRYDFYDNFRKSALIYYDYRPTAKAEFAPFFSYMPQYSQLTPAQKNYYFYWRGEVQRGRYPKTDYSYVYLYVYEILNLPDKIPPEEGIGLLCRIWREYRASLPRLDGYFAIWVQDYCLVHRLPCPTSELNDFIFDVIAVAPFKEFYLSDINRAGGGGTAALLAYLSDYDWRKGKFIGGNPDAPEDKREVFAANYRGYIEGAMSLLLHDLWSECIAVGRGGKCASIKKDAFPHCLCTHMVKRRLEIEYYPISEADGLRRGVTAAVRYTENKIRALMGVKSRLAVKDLPDDYKRIIDRYFEALFERDRKERERENAPAYERLYDAPDEKLSFDGADEIERASWDITARLIVEEELDTASNNVGDSLAPDDPDTENSVGEVDSVSAPEGMWGLSRIEIAYVAHLLGDPDIPDGFSPDPSMPEDSLAERINEAFADNFGDVIIEHDGDGYVIVFDYREDVKEWLIKQMR